MAILLAGFAIYVTAPAKPGGKDAVGRATRDMSTGSAARAVGQPRKLGVVDGRGLAAGESDVRSLIDRLTVQLLRGVLKSKCVGATSAARSSLAALIFPVLLCEVNNVHAPNDDRLSPLN